MNSDNSKQLNTFEIKREISRFIRAVNKSKVLIDEKEFALLDSQENKDEIVRLLLKEFKRCDDNVMSEIKILLERYSEPENLIDEMENIVTDNENSNNLKLHAIEVLSRIKQNWREEDYQQYLEIDEEKMYEDTKKLLENSKCNPEIQLDFLDFLATIADADKYTLLEAMAEEQSGEDLANVLVPVFLSHTDSPIGIFALNLLKSTKSVYAYRSLSEVYDIMSENLQPAIKKCLTELKFSGTDRVFDKIHDYTKGRFSFVPPDADGSYCLFYEKKYKVGDELKSDFFSLVADDYKGINECIGFMEVSEFELSVFRKKLLDRDKDAQITPEFFKYMLHKSEKLTYEKSAPPYEYNCWKQLFIDIPLQDFDLNQILNYNVKTYKQDEILDIFDEDFTAYWFYSGDFNEEAEKFYNSADRIFMSENFETANLSAVVDEAIQLVSDDKEKWEERLLLSSYFCKLNNNETHAQILYSIAKDERNFKVFAEHIAKYSIFHYFTGFEADEDYTKYKKEQLNKIINYLGKAWSFYV
ncbi:hypothetical protein J6S88_04730 [bacterium]|nr:hypothetical protein [bacterium]